MFGVLPGLVGVLQATEAIKVLLGLEASLSGKLLIYDAMTMNFNTLQFDKDPQRKPAVDLSQVRAMQSDDAWCMVPETVEIQPQQQKSVHITDPNMFNQISMAEVLERQANGWEPFILDVRTDAEYQEHRLKQCDVHVPHNHVLTVIDQIPKKTDILIHCKSGMRSQLAAIELIKAGWVADRLFNLEGGIMAWKLQSPEDIES